MIDYSCSKCGATYVKLWRLAQSAGELLCQVHAEEEQGKPQPAHGDQIGWRVPAVPTPCWTTFWGYTSVPDEGVAWWHYLRDQKDKTQ